MACFLPYCEVSWTRFCQLGGGPINSETQVGATKNIQSITQIKNPATPPPILQLSHSRSNALHYPFSVSQTTEVCSQVSFFFSLFFPTFYLTTHIAYFQSPQTGETRIWIPRRSRTKRTCVYPSTVALSPDSSTHRWPGCLDVTVGGGIGLNETASSTIVRESAEEASLDPNFVAKTIRSSGVVSFPNLSPAGWILPGLYFVFDLRLRDDGTPEPRVNKHDGEVEGFELLSVPEVLANLLDGRFKPSSALALVDFLIRHGHITPESEPRFVDVCSSLRRNLVLPVPWSVE